MESGISSLGIRFCLIHGIAVVIAQGINSGDIKKLQDAGIYTCNGLMMQPRRFVLLVSLTGIKGLSEAKVDKICEAAEKLVIVDSVIALFRVDFCGRGELAERQVQMLCRLIKIASLYLSHNFPPSCCIALKSFPSAKVGTNALSPH
ncbi:hypothetical protein B296_00016731 [Ensete ventricosum]|uniref:Rad51-like C-terminal domain-containing protein n=1 Tax=Ensete ventricosum TaxID=4639 RepID=A0A426ZDU2_ENSVE|nr:hypothetical protein B296_00016731 [Ensete ventricosum]